MPSNNTKIVFDALSISGKLPGIAPKRWDAMDLIIGSMRNRLSTFGAAL